MKKFLLLIPVLALANKPISSLIIAPGMDVLIKKARAHDSWKFSNLRIVDLQNVQGSVLVKPRNYYGGKHAFAIIKLSHPLLNLEVSGDSNVVFDNARSKNLTINNRGSGVISLKGNVNLSRVTQTNSGSIRGIWVNADKLKIEGNYGQIQLAGVCKSLHVLGERDVKINTGYLRCNDVWVNAKDYANIVINPLQHMKVWASGNSTVMFRNMLNNSDRDVSSFDQALVMHTNS